MGKQTYTNVGGTWKKNNKIHTKVIDTWKEIKKGYVNISGIWKQIHAPGGLPIGIILPYASSDSTPSGFSEYTLADSKFIIGAGGTYTNGATGGTTNITVSSTSSTNGSHTGTTFLTRTYNSGSDYSGISSNSVASGNHSHTFSTTGSIEPLYRTFRLVKTTEELSSIPQNVCVFSHTSILNGMTAQASSQEYFKASTTYNNTGGNTTASVAGTTNSSGSHSHGNISRIAYVEFGNGYKYNLNQGAHSHSVGLSGSLEPTYKYLSLWKNATTTVDVGANVIGMWEGSSAPEGWQLCDGTNGSPDMRDYFLRIGDETTHNTSGGTNSLSLSGTTSTGGSHHHKGISREIGYSNYYPSHSNTTAMAGHTFSWSGSYVPPYYALTFIIKLA